MHRTSPNRRRFFDATLRRSSLVTLLLCAPLFFSVPGCNQSHPVSDEQSPQTAATPPKNQDKSPGDVPSAQTGTNSGAVKAEFRNVMFHLTPGAAAHLESVSGELWPAGKYEMPVFDDKASFELHVVNGTVSITPDALASIMNTHVFALNDAPLKDISIQVEEDRLIIKGKLHSKGDLPFETAGAISVNADGRLRLHTEKVKALHVSVKKVMGLFGIELANVINTSKIPGMDTDKNDIIFDLGSLLPPPHIRGKIAAARLEGNAITVIYGDGGKTTAAAGPASSNHQSSRTAQNSDAPEGNYMLFRGNRVKFGRLVMENTELAVIDLDPKDPLDWDQDLYRYQLVPGYSKITDSFGLRTFVKDIGKLPKHSPVKPPETAGN
jgi:hypothetical protein